jgi:hypothetical protein
MHKKLILTADVLSQATKELAITDDLLEKGQVIYAKARQIIFYAERKSAVSKPLDSITELRKKWFGNAQ